MVLVEDRAWTRRVPELDLQCDDREVPVNLPDTYDNWVAGVYMRQSPPGSGQASELQARVALAVGDGLMRLAPVRRCSACVCQGASIRLGAARRNPAA
jgi:hypothetical protein